MRRLLPGVPLRRRLALRLGRTALRLRGSCVLLDGRACGRGLLVRRAPGLRVRGLHGVLRLGRALGLRALLRPRLLLLMRPLARSLLARAGLRGCVLRVAAARRRIGILSILGHSSLSDGRMLGQRTGLVPPPPRPLP